MAAYTLAMRYVPRVLLAISLSLVVACGDGGGGDSSSDPPADTTAPTATVTVSPRVVLAGSMVTATIIWSEPVTGFVVGDVTLGGGTAGAFTAVSATEYTIDIIAGGAGTTTVDVDLTASVCADAAGNPSVASEGHAAIAHAPWASGTGSDAYGVWADLSVTGNGETAVQRFRLIAPGTFTMGSPLGEAGRGFYGHETESQHQVTLTTPYWIADSECTQRMWKAVMNTTPSYFRPPIIAAEDLDLPVEQVSHTTVLSFMTALNLVQTNLSARLPTESEWEYAARAGTTTPFSVSPVTTDSISCFIWASDPYIASGSARFSTVEAKTLPPNPWGLYEVHGNLWEWCSDWWQDDWGVTVVVDPIGPATGYDHVLRGGCLGSYGQVCRSASRYSVDPTFVHSGIGFRLVAPGQPSGGG